MIIYSFVFHSVDRIKHFLPLTHRCIHSPIDASTHPSMHPLTHRCIHSPIDASTHPPMHPLTHRCIHSPTDASPQLLWSYPLIHLAPVVQRPDNFIQWISHYLPVSICAKISVFPRVQANMHTLTTAKFGSERKPWITFNIKYILDPE